MNIAIYSATSQFLLEKLTRFNDKVNSNHWHELYETVSYLKRMYPDKKFKEQPFNYVDLDKKTSGLIFIEEEAEEIYYVYK